MIKDTIWNEELPFWNIFLGSYCSSSVHLPGKETNMLLFNDRYFDAQPSVRLTISPSDLEKLSDK